MLQLREGSSGDRLFLVPGLEGAADELLPLVNSFSGGQEVFAVLPPVVYSVQPSDELRQIARLMVSATRQCQPRGPYRLGGYSYGGLLALEMAQQLRAAGESVTGLFLIDAIYDERFWPRNVWATSMIRRTARQLGRIARLPLREALAETLHRGTRLARRLSKRREGTSDLAPVDETPSAKQAYAAMIGYEPAFYDGVITLIAPTSGVHFGADTARLWASRARRLDIDRVAGDHLTVMREGASAVARLIDYRLELARPDWPGLCPRPGFERPMIVTTMKWFSAARLASTLVESGFEVSACRPRSHPLDAVEGVVSIRPVSRFNRMGSIAHAIRQTRPDIVLPDDERALSLLRRLYWQVCVSDPPMADVLARSLGLVSSWPVLESRTGLADVASELAVPVPPTAVVRDLAALRAWLHRHGFPVVLKTDGSWGGRGVVVARNAKGIARAWRAASRPPTLLKAIKRLLVNFEVGTLIDCATRKRPVVNAQVFAAGRDAIATVACLDGRILSIACLEVVRAMPDAGAATVVKPIENRSMVASAEQLVARLGLSGFCGFDFVLTGTGDAVLLELNPRVTPTAYLLVEGTFARDTAFALFPAALPADDPYHSAADVPVRSPALIRRGQRIADRTRSMPARIERSLSRRLRRRSSPSH
ncbi:thioesterase domain-containing protein [Aldersonia sp. NBC_00410]|uniref:thioesterase domain-containing protein n=1 Tax=Aldersonia sp. NBC_00410 TaxID=2975954 RepID=UPI00224EAEF0|nr:thioesterase domain-containing protein [Aldersonia sp. NBC_00410]MCX5041711.1 thioesterase domain-containing protein [Aldersonia sp. NBC_00410]